MHPPLFGDSMPHYRRAYIKGAWYFFTVVTHERRPILCTDASRDSLRSAVEKTRAERPFNTIAWVLLPDHLHCIWQLPDNDSDFSTRWRLIKARFTHEYIHRSGGLACDSELRPPKSSSRQRKNEQIIWQRRFWEHRLRDEVDLNHHIAYIHHNPVKHGYVDDPMDWPYSTVHRAECSDSTRMGRVTDLEITDLELA